METWLLFWEYFVKQLGKWPPMVTFWREDERGRRVRAYLSDGQILNHHMTLWRANSMFVRQVAMKSSQSFSMIPCIFMVSWKLMKPQSSVLTYSGYFFVLSSSPQCGIISRKIVTLIRWKLTKLKFMQGTSCDVGACYGALLFSVFI